MRNMSCREWGKCVARLIGCKLYANEVRSWLTFKLPSIFHFMQTLYLLYLKLVRRFSTHTHQLMVHKGLVKFLNFP